MPELSSAAVRLVIEDGIKRPLRLLLDQRCFAAAVIVTYSGMDTMAYLNMPGHKTDVMRSDFIAWAERYMVLDDLYQVSGADLYGTRCSILHGGAPSRFTREGRGRMLHHGTSANRSIPIDKLIETFFAGVDRFLREAAQDEAKTTTLNRRLQELIATGLYDVRDLHDGRKFAPGFSL